MAADPNPQPSRRVVLGGAAALTLLLAGCSLRLDRDPELPDLSAADEVRNAVARILERTEAQGTDAEVVGTLRRAVGRPWAPPRELASPSPTSEAASYGFGDGLFAAAEQIVTRFDELTEMRAVLADVAVGALGVLQAAGDRRADTLITTVETVPPQQPDTAGPTGAHTPAESEESSPQISALTAFAEACYRGSYAYERIAVQVPARQPLGARLRERISELDIAADLANERLTRQGASAAENRPAWKLAADPASGPEAAGTAVEDGLVAAIEPLFSTGQAPRLGLASLWRSAAARRALGAPQVLRFRITDSATPQTEG